MKIDDSKAAHVGCDESKLFPSPSSPYVFVLRPDVRCDSVSAEAPSVNGCYNCGGVVGVAQLAEHRTVAPDVVGSIPISHPSYPS